MIQPPCLQRFMISRIDHRDTNVHNLNRSLKITVAIGPFVDTVKFVNGRIEAFSICGVTIPDFKLIILSPVTHVQDSLNPGPSAFNP